MKWSSTWCSALFMRHLLATSPINLLITIKMEFAFSPSDEKVWRIKTPSSHQPPPPTQIVTTDFLDSGLTYGVYLINESVSHSVMSNSLWLYGLEPSRLLCPWDSPGKNTGVGCHSLLQGIFPIQGSNSHLHWRQILYHLSHHQASNSISL